MQPIILKFNVDRGFAFYPFVIVPKWATFEVSLEESYTAHELTHWERQGSMFGAVAWVSRYFFSREFRFNEELAAYHEQIRTRCRVYSDWQRMLIDQAATSMASEYWGMCSYEDAKTRLTGMFV